MRINLNRPTKAKAMDPTRELCQVRDSFSDSSLDNSNGQFSNSKLLPFTSSLNQMPTLSKPDIDNPEEEEAEAASYTQLQTLKDKFDQPDFSQARDQANPFERIGRSVFMNRAAIKLANIDAVFNLTEQITGYILQQNTLFYTFCDIAGGPGGFTEYLQYRRPYSRGYGITLHEDQGGLAWNTDRLDLTQFNITYGPDGTGNLYTNSDWFAKWVKNLENLGVDLVVSDGGFEIGTDSRNQEKLSSRLVVNEICIALQVLRTGGHFVCKIFDTQTNLMADLIYILALTFEQIHIFKPVSSRPANAERYLVCLNFKGNADLYINLLKSVNARYNTETEIKSIFQSIDDSAFLDWLDQNNSLNIKRQTEAAHTIINILTGKHVEIPEYNFNKCLAMWNLPGNRSTKQDLIKVRA